MKKLLCIVFALLFLTACSAPGTNPDLDPTGQNGPTEGWQNVEQDPQSGLTVAVSAEDAELQLWQQVCDAFTKQTGIKVEVTTQFTAQADLMLGSLPEGVNSASVTAVLETTVPGESVKLREKLIADLADVIKSQPDSLPMFYNAWALGYNKTLFQSNQWVAPRTLKQLWTLDEKADDKNISLFTYEQYSDLEGFFCSLVCAVGGREMLQDVLRYKENIWTSEKGEDVAYLLYLLAANSHNLTPSQVGTGKNLKLLQQKKVLFMPVELTRVEQTEDIPWGLTGVPAEDGLGNYVHLQAQKLYLNGSSRNWEGTKRLAAFLYSDEACRIFAQGGKRQPVKGTAGDAVEALFNSGVRLSLGEFAQYQAVTGVGSVQQTFLEPVNQMINGTLTWDEWVHLVNEASNQMGKNIVP